jgi:hypothetical protein
MKHFLFITLSLIWVLCLMVVFTNCKSAPDKTPGEPAACYDARYCIYLCGEGDKAICADYVKECSNTRIYQECLKDADNFQSCWDKLQ